LRKRPNQIRSQLYSDRTFQPVLGARHKVIESEDVEIFFSGLRDNLVNVLPKVSRNLLSHPEQEKLGDELSVRRRERHPFLIFDDPDKMAITILEQRLARKHAQRNRVRWNQKDVGRIVGQIQNNLARLDLTGRPLNVRFDNVVRLADADDKNGRKIALLPEQSSRIAEFFCESHEIAVNGLSGSLSRFKNPYSGSFIPHFTVARIFKEVPSKNLDKSLEVVKNMLPFQVTVEPISFISQQNITPNSEPNPDDYTAEDFGYSQGYGGEQADPLDEPWV